jgi:hypothetical protein
MEKSLTTVSMRAIKHINRLDIHESKLMNAIEQSNGKEESIVQPSGHRDIV